MQRFCHSLNLFLYVAIWLYKLTFNCKSFLWQWWYTHSSLQHIHRNKHMHGLGFVSRMGVQLIGSEFCASYIPCSSYRRNPIILKWVLDLFIRWNLVSERRHISWCGFDEVCPGYSSAHVSSVATFVLQVKVLTSSCKIFEVSSKYDVWSSLEDVVHAVLTLWYFFAGM